MKKQRQWWGWEILDNNGNTIGSISNQGGEQRFWNVVNTKNEIIGQAKLRKDAIQILVIAQSLPAVLWEGWITSNEILETMTDSEFRIAVFEKRIIITDMNLGQPRHTKLMGHGLFKLRKGF